MVIEADNPYIDTQRVLGNKEGNSRKEYPTPKMLSQIIVINKQSGKKRLDQRRETTMRSGAAMQRVLLMSRKSD